MHEFGIHAVRKGRDLSRDVVVDVPIFDDENGS